MENAVYVIWKAPQSRKNYRIGSIQKREKYYFSYGYDYEEACTEGFEPLIPFPDANATYESSFLFPIFSTRLPDEKRPDIDKILEKYGLEKYDEFELLKCGAELPTDNLKFVEVLNDIHELDGLEFSIAGVRHYLGCDNHHCENNCLEEGLKVIFEQDKDNCNDCNAIQVIVDKILVGYIPRYYTDILNQAIDSGKNVEGEITRIRKEKYCDFCVSIKLKML